MNVPGYCCRHGLEVYPEACGVHGDQVPADVLNACPDCGHPMGDGNRVTFGRCALCHRRRRGLPSRPPALP